MLYSGLISSFVIVNLYLLPSIHGAPVNPSVTDTVTLAAITQLLALFSQSLDNKNFTALADVFAEDAVLDGGGPTTVEGIQAIEDTYATIFQNESLRTQHTSHTIYGYNLTPTTASSTSYAEAYYFGPLITNIQGSSFSNQSVVYREKFYSDYAKGADESWKIVRQSGPFLYVCFSYQKDRKAC